MKLKHLYFLLPILSIWLSFGLVEILDLTLTDSFEYVNGVYTKTQDAGWYGFPYMITCISTFAGSIIIAGIKGIDL